MRVPLSLACGAYDRTAALARGDIRPEGADLTFLAFEQARREAAARLAETAAGASLLPWAYADAERTRDVIGGGLEGLMTWPGTRTRCARSSGTRSSRA
jgi:hypothetical protein